jgi:putative colanic acid biosynthesis UDP-glucose lipid carrier transferase
VTKTIVSQRSLPLTVPVVMLIDIVKIADFVLILAASALAEVIYVEFYHGAQSLYPYLIAGVVAAAATQQLLQLQGLYEPQSIANWRPSIKTLMGSIAFVFLLLIAAGYLLKLSGDYSRGWLLTFLALSLALLAISRPLAAWGLELLLTTQAAVRRIAIIRCGNHGSQLLEQLRNVSGVRLAGAYELDPADWETSQRVLAHIIDAGERNEFDEIIICATADFKSIHQYLIEPLHVLPMDLWLDIAELEFSVHSTQTLGQVQLLKVKPRPAPLHSWSFVAKQTVDYVGAAVGLVLLSPLFLLVAIAISLDSSGPVLFRQRRHGYNQSLIYVYKFRTMSVIETGESAVQATRSDPRVTRVGRFLRATSLDELPQLINVLKGEMSLVGPRPHAVAHNEHYGQRMSRYAHRHVVKPGLTGLAQINGFRGPTDDVEKMRRRVEYDLYYIEHWTLWLDIKILARTLLVGFVHPNAV